MKESVARAELASRVRLSEALARKRGETGWPKGPTDEREAKSAPISTSVPPGQSLANRPVGNPSTVLRAGPTCKPGNGSTELGETRVQAAGLSPEICIVVVRITLSAEAGRGKPTLCTQRKATVPSLRSGQALNTTGRGSESGACTHGGNSGTLRQAQGRLGRAYYLLVRHRFGSGTPQPSVGRWVIQQPWRRAGSFSRPVSRETGRHETREQTRYRGTSESEGSREG